MKGAEKSLKRLFIEEVKRPLRQAVSLCRHSSFEIGGKSDYFFEARSGEELRDCLSFVRERKLPFFIIGQGTNILFDDEGFRGLILKNRVRGIRLEKRREIIELDSGTLLSDLVDFSLEEGLEGAEFLAGIPGTVGGAVFGNAGAFGHCIGNLLIGASLIDRNGTEFQAGPDYFEFGYRHSSLKQGRQVLLRSSLRLRRGDRAKSKALIEEYLEQRRDRHPSQKMAYAGSYFKNPVLSDGRKIAAGDLLEKVGAKQLRVGKAAVFSGHANFIVNLGGASSRDVRLLAQELKARVQTKFGVDLEEEVIYLPADFSMP